MGCGLPCWMDVFWSGGIPTTLLSNGKTFLLN